MRKRKPNLFTLVVWATIILWLAGAFNVIKRNPPQEEKVRYEVVQKGKKTIIIEKVEE